MWSLKIFDVQVIVLYKWLFLLKTIEVILYCKGCVFISAETKSWQMSESRLKDCLIYNYIDIFSIALYKWIFFLKAIEVILYCKGCVIISAETMSWQMSESRLKDCLIYNYYIDIFSIALYSEYSS